MFEWLRNFFRVEPLHIDIARVQLEERQARREGLDRELSGRDSQECLERVRRRMALGDSVWIPPYFRGDESYKTWRHRHRRRRIDNVRQIEDRRKA